jgi:hypothetical protein
VTDLIKTIKKGMVDKGRDDFVNYAAELLGITRQWASAKMSGKSPFTDKELATLNEVLDFDASDLKNSLRSE